MFSLLKHINNSYLKLSFLHPYVYFLTKAHSTILRQLLDDRLGQFCPKHDMFACFAKHRSCFFTRSNTPTSGPNCNIRTLLRILIMLLLRNSETMFGKVTDANCAVCKRGDKRGHNRNGSTLLFSKTLNRRVCLCEIVTIKYAM